MAYLQRAILEIDKSSGDSSGIREFLSGISAVRGIGVVQSLSLGDLKLFMAFAGRFKFHAYYSDRGVAVLMSEGPTVVETWEEDTEEEVRNHLEFLPGVFGEVCEGLEGIEYLYTRHSMFVWRPHADRHLSRMKERFFQAADGETISVSSLQSDAGEGEELEYILKQGGRKWKYVVGIQLDADGEVIPEVKMPVGEMA